MPRIDLGLDALQARHRARACLAAGRRFDPAGRDSPPLVCGPGVRANVLALLTPATGRWPQPFGAARPPRSVVYLDDLVDALGHAARADAVAGGAFFARDDRHRSVAEWISVIRDTRGIPRRLVTVPFGLMAAAAHAAPCPGLHARLFEPLQVDDRAVRATGLAAPGGPSRRARARSPGTRRGARRPRRRRIARADPEPVPSRSIDACGAIEPAGRRTGRLRPLRGASLDHEPPARHRPPPRASSRAPAVSARAHRRRSGPMNAPAAVAFAKAIAVLAALLRSAVARHVLDHPGERSMHSTPTPRIGGLAAELATAPAPCRPRYTRRSRASPRWPC